LDREKEATVIKKDEEKIDQEEEKAVCYANERKKRKTLRTETKKNNQNAGLAQVDKSTE